MPRAGSGTWGATTDDRASSSSLGGPARGQGRRRDGREQGHRCCRGPRQSVVTPDVICQTQTPAAPGAPATTQKHPGHSDDGATSAVNASSKQPHAPRLIVVAVKIGVAFLISPAPRVL